MRKSTKLLMASREKTGEMMKKYDEIITRIERSPGGFDDPANQEIYRAFLDSIKGMEAEEAELKRVADVAWDRDHADGYTRHLYDVKMNGGSVIATIAAMDDEELFKELAYVPRSPFQFVPPNFEWRTIGLALPSMRGIINYMARPSRRGIAGKGKGCHDHGLPARTT